MTSLPSCSAFAILEQVRKLATSLGKGQTASCACPFPATRLNIEAAPISLRTLRLIASSPKQVSPLDNVVFFPVCETAASMSISPGRRIFDGLQLALGE